MGTAVQMLMQKADSYLEELAGWMTEGILSQFQMHPPHCELVQGRFRNCRPERSKGNNMTQQDPSKILGFQPWVALGFFLRDEMVAERA